MRSLDERASRNLAAIRLLRDLEASGRPASPGEKEALSRYSGWGAMPRVFDRWPGEWREVAENLRSLKNGIGNFVDIKVNHSSVSFNDLFDAVHA